MLIGLYSVYRISFTEVVTLEMLLKTKDIEGFPLRYHLVYYLREHLINQ